MVLKIFNEDNLKYVFYMLRDLIVTWFDNAIGSDFLTHAWTSWVVYLASLDLGTKKNYSLFDVYHLLSNLLFNFGFNSLLFHILYQIFSKPNGFSLKIVEW